MVAKAHNDGLQLDDSETKFLDEMVETLTAYLEIKDRLVRDKQKKLNITSYETVVVRDQTVRMPVYAAEVELKEFECSRLKELSGRIEAADKDVAVLYRKATEQLRLME
ncbi:MAG: hypothetical protein M3Q73_03875 [bacterium]|nr:hypothetical protein [bacterium]